MGMRLIISIWDASKGEPVRIANAYYHWGGYKSVAREYAKIIRSNYYKERKIYGENLKLLAIRCLEKTGAGITQTSLETVDKELRSYNFKPCVSRNAGILECSEKGMLENVGAGEYFVDIDITKKTFHTYMDNDLPDE